MLIKLSTTLSLLTAIAMAASGQSTGNAGAGNDNASVQWKSHDMNRPKPVVVEPVAQTLPAPVPKGAIILFGGGDLSQWKGKDSSGPKWKLENDYMEIVPGSGGITSKESFGDIQMHIEWASPDDTTRHGQDRGNSGIFFMGQYEIQVLDSYKADTYADGQAGALYGQFPPRFNACKPRGEWNAYDIAFRRPRFASDGTIMSPARITVIHNGILIQDNEAYKGPTSWLRYYPYKPHADKLPLELQEHNGKVRFRNIWVLPLPELSAPVGMYGEKIISMADADLDKFTGRYERSDQKVPITITKKDGKLYADFYYRKGDLELAPLSAKTFTLTETAGTIIFNADDKGNITSLVFQLGGDDIKAVKVK